MHLEPYALCTTSAVYSVAEAACEALGVGLVTIEDDTENRAIAQLVYQNYDTDLWIGYTDRREEGTWEWVDGTVSEYTAWYSGEPNDSGGEDCAAMYGTLGYVWNDLPCETYALPFLCER